MAHLGISDRGPCFPARARSHLEDAHSFTTPGQPSYLARADYRVAAAIAVLVLAAYGRTLAPDLLYSDSAEFQTLAYTLGTTHSTGYPVYLLLARLVGFLPWGTPAWRINLFSALGAAVAVGGVYLLARHLTSNRAGAALGALALALGGLFWSQAIIAEVYTPALAWLALLLLLLWRWDAAFPRGRRLLFAAALAGGLSLGMHLYVALIAPAAIIFVLWRVWGSHRATWKQHLAPAFAGAALGVALYAGAFLLFDVRQPPSNFVSVALYPSRSIWSLSERALDSPLQRMWLTVSGHQWRDAMFPGGTLWRGDEIGEYGRLLRAEFSLPALLLAVVGLVVGLWRRPRHVVLLLAGIATVGWGISNYHPGDQALFYLPSFVLIAVAIGGGAGFLLSLPGEWAGKARRPSAAYLSAVLALAVLVMLPFAESRLQALQAGAALFVGDGYAYPLSDLDEPRQLARLQVTYVPDDAVLVLNWRGLYSALYLAHVEGMAPGLTLIEATPHGGTRDLAESLVADLEVMVAAGRPVFVDEPYENLRDRFRLLPNAINGLYQVRPQS